MPHLSAAEIEAIAQSLWLFLTPLGLTIAALILGVRIIVAKRYRSRMSRATFILILSFAVLVDRLVLRVGRGDATTAPDAAFAVFYTSAAVYFAYALIVEWALPFFYWLYRRARGRRHEPIPETIVKGVPDA